MITTPHLIDLLAASAKPVKRLRPPLLRAAGLGSTVSYGCSTHWVDSAPDGVRMDEAARCFATLIMTSLPLSLGLFLMLRHAVWLRPTAVALTGGLALAAMTATALSLFHDLDATIMVLIWNLGVAAMIVGIGYLLGLRARAHS